MPVAKLHSCQRSQESVQILRKHLLSLQSKSSPEACPTPSKSPSSARLSSYKLPSARCQDVCCQVPSLELHDNDDSGLTNLHSSFSLLKPPTPPSPPFQQHLLFPLPSPDMFFGFWVFGIVSSFLNKIPKLNMSVSLSSNSPYPCCSFMMNKLRFLSIKSMVASLARENHRSYGDMEIWRYGGMEI